MESPDSGIQPVKDTCDSAAFTVILLMCKDMRCSQTVIYTARALAFLVVSFEPVLALDPKNSLTQYGHAAWTRHGGDLPGGVFAITQTRDGRLWVGTEFGLSHFDGITFSPWQPEGREQLFITALEPAPDGGLWIGTRNAVLCRNGAELRRYPTTDRGKGVPVSAIQVGPEGSVWIGTVGFSSGGLARIEAGKLRNYTTVDGFDGGGVHAMLKDRTGNLWIGSTNGLYRWDGKGFRKYPAHGSSQKVQAMAASPDGTIVAQFSGETGLKRLVGDILLHYGLEKFGATRVLLMDRDGTLWIGTNGQGLMRVRLGTVERLTKRDGLSGNTVLSLFEDREGNIWVGTEGGLDRFRNLPVVTLSMREGLSGDTVGSVFASKSGGVWVGTTQGLNRVHGHRIQIYDQRMGLPSNVIGSLFEDRAGRLWVGPAVTGNRSAGLGFLLNGRFSFLDHPGFGKIQSIMAVTEDRDGRLWFSDIERGLISVQGGVIENILPWSLFGNRHALALEADTRRGGLLLGFAQGGIAYYREGSPPKRYTTADGLGSGAVTDIHIDREGTGWIATQGGLSRLHIDRIATINKSNNLGCDQIHALVEDLDGAMWLNTPCGLHHITRKDLAEWTANPAAQIHPRIYAASDGMLFRSTMSAFFRRAARSADGRLWFPVTGGVAIVDPKNLHHNEIPPLVAIESVRADRQRYEPQPGLRLGPLVKDLEINYAAFSLVDPDRVRFRYMLEGYDQEWHDASGRRQAFYSALPPRRYQFRVVASNNNGVWNETGAFIEFAIEPAFYQTTWFLLLCAMGLAATLALLHVYRLRKAQVRIRMLFEERMRERTRIGSELHDTLIQSLTGLALQLTGLSKVVREPQSVRERLCELRLQAEQCLHEARESVWDLHSHTGEEQGFVESLRRIGQELTQGTTIQFRVVVTGEHRVVPLAQQVHLLRIVREALRNAVHHSSATQIQLDISNSPHAICICIADNGCGFDPETAPPGHWGLATMRERAHRIGARLGIVTSIGRGTRIEIMIPNAVFG